MKRHRARFVESLESRRLMAILMVTDTLDSGAGSLRAAIGNASSGDTIDFAVTGTITLQSALTIDKNLTINGPGEATLIISGNGSVQPFVISNSTATMSGLTITNGSDGGGGGIVVDPTSTLNLTNAAITNCVAESGGGAIFSEGYAATITLTNCSLTGNVSQNGGGGAVESLGNITIDGCTIANNIADGPTFTMMGRTFAGQSAGGGLELSQGDVSITNSTIANNTVTAESASGDTSQASGGGVMCGTNGTVTMLNCTISGNTCTGDTETGGGVDIDSNGNETFTNCLIAGNSATTEPDFAVPSGSVVSDGHNLVGQITDFSHITAANGVSGDQIGTSANPIDAKLGPLADNGGPTETMALLAGSPAIDAGSNSAAPPTDQRGDSRVGTADIGAFEFQPNHAPVFATTSLGLATAGLPYSTTVTATDADHDSLTISTVSKPSWLTVHDNGDGTATLTGTPSYLNGGSNSVQLSVDDGTDMVNHTFNFGVAVPPVVLDSNGLLSAYGTGGNDTLQIWVRGSTVRVNSNGALRNYPLGSVHAVQVFGMAGNDSITLNLKTIPGYVLGGTGDDTLVGGDEADTLSGAAGNDSINGGAGNDRLNGDGGNDFLVGGLGHDRMYGDIGNDTLDSQDGAADTLDGGAGKNFALYDAGLDLTANVLNVLT